jgi:hypothetical protein
MKKSIFFSLIGAVVLFVWQFLSFAMPNLHKSGMEYTPAQDSILAAMAKSGLKEGMYMLGQPDPNLPKAEYDKVMDGYMGKPWAVVNYQAENNDRMAMNMIRGFVMCILMAALLFWILRQQKDPTLVKRLLAALAIGLIGFFYFPYTHFIWFREADIWAYMADGTIPWLLLGWIGHGMLREKTAAR